MEIESFEPYHIGTKLKPTVDIIQLKKKIKDKLKEYKYKLLEDTSSDSMLPHIEDLAIKNDVRVVLNTLAHAINTIGDDPDKVINIFQEVNKLVLNSGYEEKSTVAFYEIITHVNIKVENSPKEILNKHSKLVMEYFKEFGKLNTIGIRLSDNLPEDSSEYTDIVIEPKSTSPNTYLLISITFRSLDKEKIIDFSKNVKANIQKIIKNI